MNVTSLVWLCELVEPLVWILNSSVKSICSSQELFNIMELWLKTYESFILGSYDWKRMRILYWGAMIEEVWDSNVRELWLKTYKISILKHMRFQSHCHLKVAGSQAQIDVNVKMYM